MSTGGCEQKCQSQRQTPSDLGLVQRQRPSIHHYIPIAIWAFKMNEMESSANFSQTATRFSELPPEILLCITSFADPETCFSILQVGRFLV